MEYESKQNRLHWLPKWQRDIIARYPRLYTEPSPETASEDYCHLRFGFECDAGWAQLIEEVSETATSLVRVLRSFGYQGEAQIFPVIVKEKLGTLRWQGRDNLLPSFRRLWWSYIADIEHRSSSICELSGKSGELRNVGSVVKTLSEAEYLKEIQRRKKR